jgi:RNA recognition motif-containing protein
MNLNEKDNKNLNTLFVGSLHVSVSEGDLIKLFTQHGKVDNLSYMWHKRYYIHLSILY